MNGHREMKLECGQEDSGISVEKFLRKNGISRRLTIALKRTPMGMTRDGVLCRTIDKVNTGDIITLKIPINGGGEYTLPPNFDLKAEKAYEDEDIIVYNKPAGMAVHESSLHRGDTLANVFAAEFPGRPFRAVNRLDRDTSGLCLAAKNRHSANISTDRIHKTYYGVCMGIIDRPMRIEAPIARENASMMKRTVREDGKWAATNIKPVRIIPEKDLTLLEIELETGRTHQIRVHLSHIGHPLAGDVLYGGSTEYIGRQALHCGKMVFTHPVSGAETSVSSYIPFDFL